MTASLANTVNLLPASIRGAPDRAVDTSTVSGFLQSLGRELSRGELQLPSFPQAVIRIRQVLSNANATATEVAEVVRSEPALTARLFKMANSALLRRGDEPVSDLHVVISRLGFTMIRNIAVAMATRQLMDAKKHCALRDDLQRLWQHSVETAAIAHVLARDCKYLDPDDAFLAGLLHDIGTFYIFSRIAEYPALFHDRDELEAIIPEWHTGIGRAILEAWGFPQALCAVVDEHDTLERAHAGSADLTDVVMVANLLAHWNGATQVPVDLSSVPAVECLNLNTETAIAKLYESNDEIEALTTMLR